MKSLKSLIESNALKQEEKIDLLLSLIESIDFGQEIPKSLDGYSVRENGTFAFNHTDDDISFAAPEFFLQNDVPLREQQWFTFGLVAYYIFYGDTYYNVKGILPFDVISMAQSNSGSLIEDSLFDGMLSVLTSWNAAERESGVAKLFNYIKDKYTSKLRVDFICNGTIVRSEMMNINGVIANYPEEDIFTGNDSVRYRVNEKIFIPFRLIPKKYRVEVTAIEEPVRAENDFVFFPDAVPPQSAGGEGQSPEESEHPVGQTENTVSKVQPILISETAPSGVASHINVEMICNGEVVNTRVFDDLASPIYNFPPGMWFIGFDSSIYTATTAADIVPLPGSYVYRIPCRKINGKLTASILMRNGDNNFERLLNIGEDASVKLNCTLGTDGFLLKLLGGYVDEAEQKVIYVGKIDINFPPLPQEQAISVTLKSYQGKGMIKIIARIKNTDSLIYENTLQLINKSQIAVFCGQ